MPLTPSLKTLPPTTQELRAFQGNSRATRPDLIQNSWDKISIKNRESYNFR
jgi:hypothetical protein